MGLGKSGRSVVRRNQSVKKRCSRSRCSRTRSGSASAATAHAQLDGHVQLEDERSTALEQDDRADKMLREEFAQCFRSVPKFKNSSTSCTSSS